MLDGMKDFVNAANRHTWNHNWFSSDDRTYAFNNLREAIVSRPTGKLMQKLILSANISNDDTFQIDSSVKK